MKITESFKRIAAVSFILICILTSTSGVARSDNSKKIKVAVLNNTTYANLDKDGVWRGLDIECMINIAQRSGLDIEFVDSSMDADFLGNLKNGTYDIVADVVKTPEREAEFSFTDTPIGNTTSTLAVRPDDTRWSYGDIEQVSRMKIGVLSSYANNTDFRNWCLVHKVTPEIIEYNNTEQMNSALFNGETDADVYTAVYSKENSDKQHTIMKFLPESFYYAFRKNDSELKNKVDSALSQIILGDVDYLINLKNKYDEQYDVNNLPFSHEEEEYLSKHPVLTVAVLADDAPYYEKKSDGSDYGIIPDYYALIADKANVQIRYVAYPSERDSIAAVKNGQVDIIGVFSGGIISSQQQGISITDRFSEIDSALLTKAGNDLSRVECIAIKGQLSYALADSIKKDFPQVTMKEYATAQDCFESMKSGDATAALLGLPSATWILNQTNTSAFAVIPVSNMPFDLCAAVNSNDQMLCSIMNKCIEGTKNNFTGIVTKDTLPQSDWKTIVAKIPPVWIILIFSILFILVLGLVWAVVMLIRRQKERAAVFAAQAETEKQKMQVESISKSTAERNKFLANISHDMRTPLNAVINFIRLAQKPGLPAGQRTSYLDKAETSGKLLLDLINDTLTVSKFSGGKLKLNPRPCRIKEILASVTSSIQDPAASKKISFSVDTSQMPDATILADKLNIEKIFLNLLTNSLKYTPEGGHINFKIAQESYDGKYLHYVITLSDDGIGIAEEFLPHIFEAFAQEMRPGYESVGTGLGLSIVKQLVDLMHGSISVESKVNVGTTFVVHLQFEKLPDAPAAPAELPTHADISLLNGKKILLCEDNAINREIAIAMLEDKGISITVAENGKEGLDIFSFSKPDEFDAVLMDIRMPVMNGFEATQAMRALDRPDAVTMPIIAMTADAFSDDIQNCLNAGMNMHIAKPIEPQQLYRVLSAEIGKRNKS